MKTSFRLILLLLVSAHAGYGQNIDEALTDTLRFTPPLKLDKAINSDAEEGLTLLSPDGKTMYFARTFHPQTMGGKNAGQDIWTAVKANDTWKNAEHATEPLNSKGNDAVLGVCRNGNRIYLLNQQVNEKSENPGISASDRDGNNGAWSAPKPVVIPEFEIYGHFYSAFVSPEEDFMLLTVPLEGDSAGNNIYVSLSADRGASWSVPKSLGKQINSASDEISPYYDASRKLLYFSRNRADDEMDYDIYFSRKLNDSWTEWSTPSPVDGVNSENFDAYFMLTQQGEAYFSSNRNGGLSDIYFCTIRRDTILPDSIFMIEPEPIAVDISEPMLIIETSGGTTTNRELSSLTREELTAETTNIRFVYFDFDKYSISKRYFEVLDDANKILDKYPDLNLRIEGHTDAVGSESYNQVLSENRSGSVKEFMVIQGQDPGRIETVGFGKSRPLSTNYTDEGRAKNRRVELFFREKM